MMIDDGGDKTALPNSLLRGQVAIVTGGARGIGRATVLRLAEAGANVIVNYARNEAAAEAVARLAREFGVRALPLRALDFLTGRHPGDRLSLAPPQALCCHLLRRFAEVFTSQKSCC